MDIHVTVDDFDAKPMDIKGTGAIIAYLAENDKIAAMLAGAFSSEDIYNLVYRFLLTMHAQDHWATLGAVLRYVNHLTTPGDPDDIPLQDIEKAIREGGMK